MGLRGIVNTVKKNPKKALAAGAAGAYLTTRPGEQEDLQQEDAFAPLPAEDAAPSQRFSQTQTSKTAGRTAETIAVPKLPELQLFKDLGIKTQEDYNKQLSSIMDEYKQGSAASRSIFRDEKKQLDAMQEELKSQYAERRKQAEEKGDKQADIARWANVAETVMNAALTIYAAQQGLARNQNVVGGISLSRQDWQAQINAALDRAQKQQATLLAEEREYAGDIKEKGRELSKEEEQRQSQAARFLEKEQDRLTRTQERAEDKTLRKEEANIDAQNKRAADEVRLKTEIDKFNANQRDQAAGKETVTTTEGEKPAKAGTAPSSAAKTEAARLKALAEAEGALGRLDLDSKDKTATDEFIKQARLAGIPTADIQTALKEITGEGLFNLKEKDKAQAILEKYKAPRPVQAPAPAPAGDVVYIVDTANEKAGKKAFTKEQAERILQDKRFKQVE